MNYISETERQDVVITMVSNIFIWSPNKYKLILRVLSKIGRNKHRIHRIIHNWQINIVQV